MYAKKFTLFYKTGDTDSSYYSNKGDYLIGQIDNNYFMAQLDNSLFESDFDGWTRSSVKKHIIIRRPVNVRNSKSSKIVGKVYLNKSFYAYYKGDYFYINDGDYKIHKSFVGSTLTNKNK